MTRKTILRKLSVELIHDPIPGDLCQDAGCGYAQADPITSNKGGMLDRKPLHGKAIHQGMKALMSIFMKTR